MIKKPEELIKKWLDAVNAGDVNTVLGFYNEKAVLIPTFSNRILGKPAQIKEYFDRLAGREGLSVALHDKTLVSQPSGEDIYALSGIYCWRFMLDAEMLSFEARFTYLLDISQERPILHHHSSEIPRML